MARADGSTRILWQRLDETGTEWCEVTRSSRGASLSGVALVGLGGEGYRVGYHIDLDAAGHTRSVRVDASGREDHSLVLDADGSGHWRVGDDGAALAGEADDAGEAGDVIAILDVDLGFSPVTNSLPIWRLGPAIPVGGERAIRVAWVLFPSLEVVVGRQSYTRLGERTWRYRSSGFAADLEVGPDGLVETYGGYWEAIARS
jgi:hypothetical protein